MVCPVVQACIPLLAEYVFIMQEFCPHFPHLSQFSIYDQSKCLHGNYGNYSLPQDYAHSLRYLKLNNYVLGLGTCCLVDTGHLRWTCCIHRQCMLRRFLWNVNEYIPNSIASYPRRSSRFFWNFSKYLPYCMLLHKKKQEVCLKHCDVTTTLHDITIQKTVNHIVTAVGISSDNIRIVSGSHSSGYKVVGNVIL